MALAPLLHADRPGWELLSPAACSVERRYRAVAQVLFLGVPIYRRADVGGGRASWQEWPDGTRRLEFGGYSSPERAAGLSRVGFIRELSRPVLGGAESIYFGLMTSSPEENAEEARQALHSNAKDAAYTAIEGHLAPGNMETVTAHFTGPARLSAGQLSVLEAQARRILDRTPRNANAPCASGAVPQPFLHALAGALRAPSPSETRYSYAGRMYRLTVLKTADEEAAASFRTDGLLPPGHQLVRVAGIVHREAGGKPIGFRIWVDTGASCPVPLRIEYQAKSYLRLTFEAIA